MTANRLEQRFPAFAARRCLRSHHASSSCTLCIDACPRGALKLMEGRVGFLANRCTGCGACTGACPQDALLSFDPDDSTLLRSVMLAAMAAKKSPSGELKLRCANARVTDAESDDPAAVRLPCLMGLKDLWLIAPAVFGAKRLTLVTGGCDGCMRHVPGRLSAVTAHAQALLSHIGRSLEVREESRAASVNLGRRALFGRMAAPAAQSRRASDAESAHPAEPETIRSALAAIEKEPWQRVPEQHMKLTAMLASVLTDGKAAADGADSAALWKLPEFHPEKCSGCALCASSCPTGALIFETQGRASEASSEASGEDQRFHLMLVPRNCTGCGLCAEICYAESIKMVPQPLSALLAAERRTLGGAEVDERLFTASFEDRLKEFTDVPIYRT